jgi:H/ACA ribonucleoprotein complex subunit 3
MDVFINGKRLRIKPTQAIAKGGEADIFDMGGGQALKLFKPPDHPDYQGLPQEQQAASDRLQRHQQKLPQFPRHLPSRVIVPDALATSKVGAAGRIVGYTMPFLTGADLLLRYGERSFRQGGIGNQTVVEIFQDLHNTVSKLHFAGVVIGDFNDLNVLVKGTEAYLIDADSFQFSGFPCTVFTARFVDPLLCDANASQPMLQQPHTTDSDWYALTVMLMQCLLFVDPYGGVYKPTDPTQRIPPAARSLHRITIFHPEVKYPKPAIPYTVLSDDLLHYFHQVFEQDQRGELPRSLLDNLRWTTCPQCGIEHARLTCPQCLQTQLMPAPQTTSATVRGTVTVTRLFHTEGVILQATVEHGQLFWLYHDRDQFKREDGSVMLEGDRQPHLYWRIQGKTTLLGYQGQVVRLGSASDRGQPSSTPERIAVDSRNHTPLFDSTSSKFYWIHQGQLHHTPHSLSPTPYPSYIGDVLPEQTYFWVGSHFGFGFYRAGNLSVAFVFDGHRSGINDRVPLPTWQGQLIDATCAFSSDRAWLFLTTQEQGHRHYRCVVIQADGTVLAHTHAIEGDDHWLAILGNGRSPTPTCPYCAVNNFMLAATDDGILRIEQQNGQLLHTKTFPDTEPFVNSQAQLLPAPNGLYVVHPQQIYQIRI